MDKKFAINPNTIERMERHYAKLSPETERFNDWLIPYLMLLIPPKGEVLEVGCGMGRTLAEIKKQMNGTGTVSGIDISNIAIYEAGQYHNDISFEVKDAAKLNEVEKYDLIVCSQTLEHVDDPKAIIKNMVIALKFGGKLLITVPYPKSSLDDGVKLHHWRFYESDFNALIPGCKCKKEGKNHLIVTWQK